MLLLLLFMMDCNSCCWFDTPLLELENCCLFTPARLVSTLSNWLKEVGGGLVLKEMGGLVEMEDMGGLVPGARLSAARYRRPRLSSPPDRYRYRCIIQIQIQIQIQSLIMTTMTTMTMRRMRI